MARYNLEQLLQEEKSELEKKKLAIDIYQAEDRYAWERKKFRTENWRFFIIAILTAFISLGSSYLIEMFKENNSSKLDLRKEFADLRKTYLGEEDKVQKDSMACQLAHFNNSYNDSRISIEAKKFEAICNSKEIIQTQTGKIARIDTSSLKTQQTISRIAILDKKIQDLKQQPSSDQQNADIKILTESINRTIDSTPEIRQAVISSETIEKNVNLITSTEKFIKSNDNNSSSKSETQWFKEGYFLQFDEYRITLRKLLKNNGIMIEVCKTKGSENCEHPLVPDNWAKFGQPLHFSDEGHEYQINLEAIDHAGKNPFTLAAYISFEKIR